MPAVRGTYRWDFYRDVDHLRQFRDEAYRAFLEDFRREGRRRYVPASLERLPFPDGAFTHALVSHFLFLYEDQLDLEFHRRALHELVRVTTREVRIYPLVNFGGERSRHFEALLKEFGIEERPVSFEFLRNATGCGILKARR
jgi:ubiquinone/menaquinone biosynthesis C-methylase UbiE